MNSLFKFPRRVRIHGGECGAVARALHHEAKSLSLPAVKKNVFFTTNERKQMSTKITLKRIALVAVSALGFGLMTAVAPAQAGSVYTSSISVSTNKAPVAGANGTAVVHTVRFQSATLTTGSNTASPRIALTSKPSASTMALQAIATSTVTSGKAEFTNNSTVDSGSDMNVNGATVTFASETGYTYYTALAYLHAHYDAAGTYVWTVWDDSDSATGTVNGTEVATTFTVVVGATGSTQTYTATTTTWGSSTVKKTNSYVGQSGSLIRIALKDSAGNPASPDTAGGVKVSVSGSGIVQKVNDSGSVAGASSFILSNGDFDGNGYAWVNITDTVAETVVVTFTGSGSMASSFTAPASVALTFATAVPSATTPLFTLGAASGLKSVTAMTASVTGQLQSNKLATSITFQTGKSAATAAAKDAVNVVDTMARITGLAGADYDLLVTEGTTGCTYCGTFTISGISYSALTDQTFSLFNADGRSAVITSKTAEATTVIVLSSDSFKAAPAAKNTFAVEVDDQFGAPMPGVAVSASVAGRNATVAVASAVTNSDGIATVTYTDASTSTTSLVDTVTFTSNGNSDTATVTYTSATNFGAGSILLTTAVTKTTGADADVLSTMYWDITAGKAGPTEGKKPVTITVKDANSVVLAGVPVTVTVSGSGCGITNTTQTVYTSATGTATAQVYGWITGKCVVTGTVGSLSDDVNTYWYQATAGETRTFTAASNNARTVTVTAADRFGNPVVGAAFKGTIIGDGFFGTGTNVATGETGTDGSMKFLTLADTKDVTVRVTINATGDYQADALKGLVDNNTSTNTFTATTAGDSLTDETGVGASFDAAGTLVANPNGLDAVVKGAPDASTVAAEAASDAAAEAIDAANAATDAANLAAEAADAATVAAEEARDAADAATAAVEELATQVATLMAALKAQITTLANTVAKIAKKVKA
jgi:hypothetical protein